MHCTITTVITTEIDLDTMTPKHSVEIESEDALPRNVVVAAALGGCRAAAKTLEKDEEVETVREG